MSYDTAEASAGALAASSYGATRDPTALRDRRFFAGLALVLLFTVFAGFARTYYFNDLAATPFSLTPALHWHGAVFSAWMLLLVIQTALISSGRRELHRRLGIAGAVLAVAMVWLGIYVALSRTASGAMLDRGVPPLLFLAVPVIGMVVFAALVGAALHFRRQPAIHKRLMMLATLELVTAGISRLPLVESWGPPGFFGVTDLFVAAIVVYDWLTLGRVHKATLWGGVFLVVSQPARLIIGGTSPWLTFAAWLTS
jgi:hypothetical protein